MSAELTMVELWTVVLTSLYIGGHFFDGIVLPIAAGAISGVVLGTAVLWMKNRGGRYL